MLIVPPSSSGEQFLATTYTEHPDGTIAFREPMSGEPISADAVPEVLRNWPVLSGGFDFLEQYGERIDFTVLLSPHTTGQDIVDAGIDLRSEAERISADQGILFLEGLHYAFQAGQLSQIYNDVARGESHPSEHRAAFTDGDETFQADVLELLYQTGVRVEQPDIRLREAAGDMDLLGPVHATLDRWNAATTTLRETEVSPQSSKDLLIAETGFHNYREWMIVGIIGACLSRFADRPESVPIVGALLIGSGHTNIASKLEGLLGRPVRVEGESSIPTFDRYAHHIMRGIGRAALAPSDIRDFQNYQAGVTGPKYFQ
jgi:hypothetical protein